MMRTLLCAAVLCRLAAAGGSAVLELTDASFDASIAASDAAFVLFYAPWCGICKKVMPTWLDVATRLQPGFGDDIRFIQVDATFAVWVIPLPYIIKMVIHEFFHGSLRHSRPFIDHFFSCQLQLPFTKNPLSVRQSISPFPSSAIPIQQTLNIFVYHIVTVFNGHLIDL